MLGFNTGLKIAIWLCRNLITVIAIKEISIGCTAAANLTSTHIQVARNLKKAIDLLKSTNQKTIKENTIKTKIQL